jgi:hypothetical protein
MAEIASRLSMPDPAEHARCHRENRPIFKDFYKPAASMSWDRGLGMTDYTAKELEIIALIELVQDRRLTALEAAIVLVQAYAIGELSEPPAVLPGGELDRTGAAAVESWAFPQSRKNGYPNEKKATVASIARTAAILSPISICLIRCTPRLSLRLRPAPALRRFLPRRGS